MKIANVTHSACIATGISDLSAPTIDRAEREARGEGEGGVVRHKSGFKAKPGVVGNEDTTASLPWSRQTLPEAELLQNLPGADRSFLPELP